jgi:hypothetical protein
MLIRIPIQAGSLRPYRGPPAGLAHGGLSVYFFKEETTMSSFTVRVELHNATWADYDSLHTAMEQRGFRRTIKSDQGINYRLPTAEYDMSGSISTADVLGRAKAAATTTSRSFGVLVSETNKRTWEGLEAI